MDVTAPIFPIAEAAALAGLRPGYVRGLLANGRFALFAALPAKGRAVRASLIDVWRLRCLCVLRDAGLTEADALWVLDLELSHRVGALFAPGLLVPMAVLAGRVEGVRVHVVPDDGGAVPDVYTTSTGRPAEYDAEMAVTLNLDVILAGVVSAVNVNRQAVGPRRAPLWGSAVADVAAPTLSPPHAPAPSGPEL